YGCTSFMHVLYLVVDVSFFLVLVQITRLFTFLSHQAFTFSFMDQLIDAAEDIIQSVAGVNNGLLGNGLWGSLLG
ncbi:hypothetical protein, partial [Klebsiella pneumoniae]|uniref:hypothetical protein n=1 Tax=Klebsiella pneumoniae TaxID=573 RepID=UPI001967F5C9